MINQKNKSADNSEVERLQSHLADYSSKIAQLEFKNSILAGEVARLTTELAAQRRLRRQVKELYHSVDHLILSTIDRRGYTRKLKTRSLPEISLGQDQTDRERLMTLLREYDAKAYFRLKSPKTAMKLRYRIMSKTYRATRDGSIKVAVKLYRLKGGNK